MLFNPSGTPAFDSTRKPELNDATPLKSSWWSTLSTSEKVGCFLLGLIACAAITAVVIGPLGLKAEDHTLGSLNLKNRADLGLTITGSSLLGIGVIGGGFIWLYRRKNDVHIIPPNRKKNDVLIIPPTLPPIEEGIWGNGLEEHEPSPSAPSRSAPQKTHRIPPQGDPLPDDVVKLIKETYHREITAPTALETSWPRLNRKDADKIADHLGQQKYMHYQEEGTGDLIVRGKYLGMRKHFFYRYDATTRHLIQLKDAHDSNTPKTYELCITTLHSLRYEHV